jgi:hypothetical protein
MPIILIYFAMLLGSGFWTPQNNPDCIWSFDIDNHQVYKGASHRSLFNGQFPSKHFTYGNSIFFFDSCGTFKKSITIAEDQRMRVSDRVELIFIRDNMPIYSDAAACSVQVLSGTGDILCKSYFNIMLFNRLIGIEGGRGYFTGPSSFYALAFFDGNLVHFRDAHEYYALNYLVHETRREILFLASAIGGPLNAITETFLICTDYKGNVLWSVSLGRILTKSFHIQVNADKVVICFEDDASNARLIIYTSRGEATHNVILPYRPVAISNILDDRFVILHKKKNHLVAHVYSVRTNKPKEFSISYDSELGARYAYAVEFHKGNKLLISSRRGDTWDYGLYKRFNKLLDAATINQEFKPMVFVDHNDMLIVRMESKKINIIVP